MSIQQMNTTFELRITPNKRKRENLKERTPQQLNNGNNKENLFVYNNFLEVKSIAELVESNNSKLNGVNVYNPYEIVRKPPKKKNRKDVVEDSCFVNPALNLNGPEHVFNPFEVRRAAPLPEAIHHCFENTGLNIRTEERHAINPFEIVREATTTAAAVENTHGIENPSLEVHQTPLAISVPFTPTLGCRIDFKNIPIEDLTPSAMLNRHLVFSPVKKPNETTPKRPNLSIISEEAVDISKELDCYQLELENSMNEAKATNKRGNKNLMDIKRKNSFARRLSEIHQETELKSEEDIESENVVTENLVMENVVIDNEAAYNVAIDNVATDNVATDNVANNSAPEEDVVQKMDEHSCDHDSSGHNDCPKSSTPKTPNENCIAKYSLDKSISINENPDVVYEEVNETHVHDESKCQEKEEEQEINIQFADETEIFKNPAPFVRAYRRDVRKRPTTTTEPAHIELEKLSKNEDKHKESNEVFSGIRSSIRKSIRKLIHPNSSNKSKNSEEMTPTKDQAIPNPSNNLLNTIRHSLRRKQPKQPLATSTPRQSLNDVSIIDMAEPRAVYKDTVFSARINNVDDDLLRPRTNLRNSLRRSKHAVKSVFKKNEDYAFKK